MKRAKNNKSKVIITKCVKEFIYTYIYIYIYNIYIHIYIYIHIHIIKLQYRL